MDTYTENQRMRLAVAVGIARVDKGWSKEEAARRAGMSSITWKRVEDGMRVQPTKLRAVEVALDWAAGSMTQVAKGGAPIIGEPAAPPETGVDVEEQILNGGPLSDETKVYLIRLVREDRARVARQNSASA